MDPVELRRRNIVREGDESATRQVFTPIAAAETLERAVEMIGYGRELPDDEAIGVAVRLVAVVRDAVGRVREDARRRLGHDRHRRPGVRHRLGDGAADAGGRGARDAAGGVHGRLPGHRRRAVGRGRVRLADDVQQRPRRRRRGGRRARPAARAGRGGARGRAGRPRARRRPRAGEGLADDRRGRSPSWPRRPPATSSCSGAARDRRRRCRSATRRAAPGGWGWSRSWPPRSSPTPCRCKVDRATGVVRVLEVAAAHDSGRVLNRMGADGQVEGGVAMGIGMALSEGIAALRRRPPAATPTCSTTSCRRPPTCRRSRSTGWGRPTRTAGRTAQRRSAEPPCVPTPGAIGNAIAKVAGRVRQLPMTPLRVWEAMQR